MKIRIHAIGGISRNPSDLNARPNFSDIYRAHRLINDNLEKERFKYLGGVIDTKPSLKWPRMKDSYLKENLMIDNSVYMERETGKAILEILIASSSEQLEGVFLNLSEASGILIKLCKDFGEFEIHSNLLQKFTSVYDLKKYLKENYDGSGTVIKNKRN